MSDIFKGALRSYFITNFHFDMMPGSSKMRCKDNPILAFNQPLRQSSLFLTFNRPIRGFCDPEYSPTLLLKMPRKRQGEAGEEHSKKRKMNRLSLGENVKPPTNWANPTVQKMFQSIAAYAVAGCLFEKGKLGTKGQHDIFTEGYFGTPTVESKARNVIHGSGRFSRLFVDSPNGPKTVDSMYISGGEKLIQFESVTYESISRAVGTNTAAITGEALFTKYYDVNKEAKKN